MPTYLISTKRETSGSSQAPVKTEILSHRAVATTGEGISYLKPLLVNVDHKWEKDVDTFLSRLRWLEDNTISLSNGLVVEIKVDRHGYALREACPNITQTEWNSMNDYARVAEYNDARAT